MKSRRSFLVCLLAATAACSAPWGLAAHGAAGPRERLDVVTREGKVHHFKVEVVDNEETRERGLMFRRSLAPDAGMLFDFKTPREVAFWMKNTYIPLDIVFIGANGRILNIAREATPLSEETLPSDGEALGVLEIKGGRAGQLDIRPGDLVRHRIFH